MLDRIVAYARSRRLGAAFTALTAAFVGVANIAFTTERFSPEAAAIVVPHEIALDGPVSADGYGLMLQGYDPVAYFVERKPRMGAREWQVKWNGVRYRFASSVNRTAFLTDPTRFAPRFGGHDAQAVRLGELRSADPTRFRIVDDQLFLLGDVEAERDWALDERHNAAVATAVWPKLAALRAR